MYLQKILSILLIINTIDATQNINLTIDSPYTDLCITSRNLSYYTCNTSRVISIDGTSDNEIHFITPPVLPTESSTLEQIEFFIYTPLNWILISIPLFLSLLCIGIAMVCIYKFFHGK